MFTGNFHRFTDTFFWNCSRAKFSFTGTFLTVHVHFWGSRAWFFQTFTGRYKMFTDTFATLFTDTFSRFTGKKKTLIISMDHEQKIMGPVSEKPPIFFRKPWTSLGTWRWLTSKQQQQCLDTTHFFHHISSLSVLFGTPELVGFLFIAAHQTMLIWMTLMMMLSTMGF